MDAFMIILAVVLFVMIVLSSFFSMSETTFTSVSLFRLKEMAADVPTYSKNVSQT